MSRLRRLLFLASFGAGGLAVLLTLGFWQLSRLDWKQELIATIEARAAATPVAVAGDETPEVDDHRSALAAGAYAFDAAQIRYLTSKKGAGPGFRLIAAFTLEDGGRILVDRGFAPEAVAPRGEAAPAPPAGPQRLKGRLRWPDETSAFTPEPNRADLIWFARDVTTMAEALDAQPVLLVLDGPGAPGEWPLPEPPEIELPNNHLGYAITWFCLAAIWLAMSLFLGFRTGE